jgi:ubiquinone/menaquinone biosynthesis C-methylase UbiE
MPLVGEAYSATGAAWQAGPGRVYDRLAEVLVDLSPVPLRDRRVLDVGAGTGAASRAIRRVGGRPIACDVAVGMLAVDRRRRPPAIAADVRRLPVASRSCGALVAAFSFNHVPDPHRALAEAARVVVPGGAVLASSYATDDDHPAKAAVDRAAREAGWVPEPWVDELRRRAMPKLATPAAAVSAAKRAGLRAEASVIEAEFPDLQAADLLAWRLGMAAVAPFVASLSDEGRRRLSARALDLIGEPEVLVRRMVVLRARL